MQKSIYSVLVLTVTLLVAVFMASLAKGQTYTDDFEGPIVLDWNTDVTSTTPSGRTFLGPFQGGQVSLTVPMPEGYHYAVLEFDVYAIGEWSDSGTGWLAEQHLPSKVWQGNGGMQLLTASRLMSYVKRTETDTLGYAEPDRVYHFRTGFTGRGEEYYRADFTGRGDMLWGLDNVTVYSVIPEPSTFILLGMGAVGLLLYGWRRRRT